MLVTRGYFGQMACWYPGEDSNPQPLGPKPSALSIELPGHVNNCGVSGGIRTHDLLDHNQAPWTNLATLTMSIEVSALRFVSLLYLL